MRKVLPLAIMMFLLLAGVVAAGVATTTFIYFIMWGTDYYLIPKINTQQNLIRTEQSPILVDVLRQSISDPTSNYLFWSASVTANMTTPAGTFDYFTFSNLANGSYFYNYSFNQMGTYILNIKAEHSQSGYSLARAYIYVGKFPVNIKILGTEYQFGQSGTVWVFAEDGNGNPINGGSGTIKIVRNDTVWNESTIIEATTAAGAYYYNFDVPNEELNFLVCVNFTAGSNSDYECSETFHVSATADVSMDKKDIVAAIILIPLIFSFILLFGAGSMSDEHTVLKISLFLLSIIPFFVSAHFSVLSLIEYYDFPELQTVIGSTVYWIGMVLFVIFIYFLIYILYIAIHQAAQNKKAKLEY